MKSLFLLTAALALTVVLLPSRVWAHGAGKSFEKTVGEYTVEMEYEALELQADESVRLSFAIAKKDAAASVEFTDAWVRITQGTEAVFAGDIHNPEFGKVGATVVFPEGGDYEVSVRFQNKDQTLAEASFPVTVAASTEQNQSNRASQPYSWLVGGILGLVAGYSLSFLKKRKS